MMRPRVENVLVVRRSGDAAQVTMKPGRDVWWHDEAAKAGPNRHRRARADGRRASAVHPLHLRHDRQTQGLLHTTGGYLRGTSLTHKWIFDLKEDDVYWCTADIGWVTGHCYIVYGPLANGATS